MTCSQTRVHIPMSEYEMQVDTRAHTGESPGPRETAVPKATLLPAEWQVGWHLVREATRMSEEEVALADPPCSW